jgi:hypothetical protein
MAGEMNKLVLNKEEAILKFSINLLPAQCRVDTLEGQEYTVVPMVILTEGVHSGSLGPLYYPKSELSKTPVVWNHKPIVVYHPTMNGVGVSACDPVIINSRKVGLMMNTQFEKGKLKSEAWIQKDRANTVDERIMSAINSREMMELSTGVFVDMEEKEGEFNGESYVGIAKNYRPDHLALLPDQIGACSIADGAGFLRNAAAKQNIPLSVIQAAFQKIGLAGNELSHSDIYATLSSALRTKFGEDPMLWVADVFTNFVIYEREGKFFRLGYTSNDTQVQLSDETPVAVVKVSEYRTVQNKSNENENSETIMNPEIKKLVDLIVGNAKWSEEDREKLGKQSKARLEALVELKKENPAMEFTLSKIEPPPVKNEVKVEVVPVPVVAPVASVTTNQQTKIITVDDYIGAAPRQIQEVLANGLHIYNEEKDKIVATILANESNSFTKEELNGRPLGELRKMVQLMGVKNTGGERTPTYAGQAPTPGMNAEKEEALEMPAMNFGR